MSATKPSNPTICILGCGGFIGSHLLERILSATECTVYGIDIQSSKIGHLLSNDRLTFVNLNVYDTESVAKYVHASDIVISLVALCNPALYNTIPLEVIDINFNRPYELLRMCAEEEKWLVHFSTSEVYGKTLAGFAQCNLAKDHPDNYVLNEDSTPLILGPVHAQRWSYACAKQLLERVIYAYGFEKGLKYTVVRPFNFIGPRMDYIPGIDGEGVPRVLACFMEALLFHKPLWLVDGGLNKRVFTYIDDAVDALMAILENPKTSQGEIFNIGNPANEISIARLARRMVGIYKVLRPGLASCDFTIKAVSSHEFYGKGYEDSDRRVPDISKIQECTGWRPHTDIDTALRKTIQSYIEHYARDAECREAG
ncbi:MAG: bifunctional UDP-4-keto-pentose/UDP-xylose synthase [Chitinivibrionales bacterium]|nr:bifunctional UDP-4-keto-pentose/UDP-xylose synthase [Chitinivibrionales bacterium]